MINASEDRAVALRLFASLRSHLFASLLQRQRSPSEHQQPHAQCCLSLASLRTATTTATESSRGRIGIGNAIAEVTQCTQFVPDRQAAASVRGPPISARPAARRAAQREDAVAPSAARRRRADRLLNEQTRTHFL